MTNTIDVIRLLAHLRRRGHEIGYEQNPPGSRYPYALLVSKHDQLSAEDSWRLQAHHREIVVELIAEQYRALGIGGRNARRVARQQDILVRCGFTVKELQAIRYREGIVEIVPAIVAQKGKKT
ncbi:MAG: hypothetical protein KF805_12730 [Phycisphaeraceae bacterium]|nr:hypothetical protein [Phycisphaeraceae bacterium]